MVDGEHRTDSGTVRRMHQRRVGEVHGAVGVALHQFFESRQVVIDDRKHGDGIRPEQPPSRGHTSRVAAEKMEQLSQNGCGSPKWQTQTIERRDTAAMPLVIRVEEGQ